MEDDQESRDDDRRSRFSPTTKLGRLSVRLLAAALGIFVVAVIYSLTVEYGGREGSKDVVRFIVGLAFLSTGMGTLVTAAIAVIRDGERSILCWLALALGLLATVFVLSDIVVPH